MTDRLTQEERVEFEASQEIALSMGLPTEGSEGDKILRQQGYDNDFIRRARSNEQAPQPNQEGEEETGEVVEAQSGAAGAAPIPEEQSGQASPVQPDPGQTPGVGGQTERERQLADENLALQQRLQKVSEPKLDSVLNMPSPNAYAQPPVAMPPVQQQPAPSYPQQQAYVPTDPVDYLADPDDVYDKDKMNSILQKVKEDAHREAIQELTRALPQIQEDIAERVLMQHEGLTAFRAKAPDLRSREDELFLIASELRNMPQFAAMPREQFEPLLIQEARRRLQIPEPTPATSPVPQASPVPRGATASAPGARKSAPAPVELTGIQKQNAKMTNAGRRHYQTP